MDDLTKRRAKQALGLLYGSELAEDPRVEEFFKVEGELLEQLPAPLQEAARGLLDVFGYIHGRLLALGAKDETIAKLTNALSSLYRATHP